MDVPGELRAALDEALAGQSRGALTAAVQRLSERYRAGGPASAPILATPVDAAAYAAYRMPATYAAVLSSLRQAGLTPSSLLDLGGGTGAALWAAASAYPSLRSATVLDQAGVALELGERLASSGPGAVGSAVWRRSSFPAAELPAADLVTAAYVLGELSPAAQADLVRAAAGAGQAVALVEPGTPDGYRRILAARDQLIGAGWTVLAPCPHQLGCPLAGVDDWCHFAARVTRSALHRRLKDGTEPYEDEKFSHVVAVRSGAVPSGVARILRHPRQRKGLVEFELCRPAGDAARVIVSKRQGTRYRAARDVGWGDVWPADTAQ